MSENEMFYLRIIYISLAEWTMLVPSNILKSAFGGVLGWGLGQASRNHGPISTGKAQRHFAILSVILIQMEGKIDNAVRYWHRQERYQ